MLSKELEQKYRRLQEIFQEMKSVVLGYSGGVDSTLLLKVGTDTIGKGLLAVIGKSQTYPTSEYEEAVRLVEALGANYREVETEETDNLKFAENPPDRCYHCKTELFSKLHDIAAQEHIIWIADGTIVDDIGDFRPGLKAKKESGTRSPLLEAEFSKDDVRELSHHLGLPTWDKPSFACLASRFPYGTEITKENLSRIDRAETILRQLGFRQYRVRHHDDRTARIEIPPQEFHKLIQPEVRDHLLSSFRKLGFTYIALDLNGYRTGSMNEVLSIQIKQAFSTPSEDR